MLRWKHGRAGEGERARPVGRWGKWRLSSLLPPFLLPGGVFSAAFRVAELRAGPDGLAWEIVGVGPAAARGRARVTLRPMDPTKPAYLRTPAFDLSYDAGRGSLAMPAHAVGAVIDELSKHLPASVERAHRLEEALRGFRRPVLWSDEARSETRLVAPPEPESPAIPCAPSASVRFSDPCGLRCVFCDAHRLGPSGAAPPPEVQLRRLAQEGVSAVLFCDAEPLAHPRIRELTEEACRLGLRVEAQTAGPPLADRARVAELARAGLSAVHVALYGPCEAIHDELVGRRGAFDDTVAGIAWAREAGLTVRGATVVLRKNVDATQATVRLLARLSGTPAVRLTWARPPSRDPERYRELAVPPSRGLGPLVAAFGPALLWRRPLLWWAPPCLARRLGAGESPHWRSAAPPRPRFDREPHHTLAPCPLSGRCAYDCQLYEVYLEAFGAEGLDPVMSAGPPLPLDPVDVSDATTVWGL